MISFFSQVDQQSSNQSILQSIHSIITHLLSWVQEEYDNKNQMKW